MRINGGTSTVGATPDTNLVDSNMVLRLAERGHPMYPIALNALSVIGRRKEPVYACPQNFTEFWAVATRPLTANGLGMTTTQAESELTRVEFLFPLLPDSPAVYPAWRRLVIGAGVSGKPTHDARILAFAQVYGIKRLLTFNVRDFTRYASLAPDVQIVDPSAIRA